MTIKRRNIAIITALNLILTLSLYNIALADESNFYISGQYGQGQLSPFYSYQNRVVPVKPKNTHIFGIAAGTLFDSSRYNLRGDIALNYFYNRTYHAPLNSVHDIGAPDFIRQKVSSSAIFGNIYTDIANKDGFGCYFGAGLGVAYHAAGDVLFTLNDEDGSEEILQHKGQKKADLAWNIGAGLSYQLNQTTVLDLLNYKYYDLGTFSIHPDADGDKPRPRVKMHSLLTGIRMSF